MASERKEGQLDDSWIKISLLRLLTMDKGFRHGTKDSPGTKSGAS